jgi:hypothetical protein
LIVELEQLHLADDLGERVNCGICGAEFERGFVNAYAYADDGSSEVEELCVNCVEMLGSRYPERFPTLEEYRAREAEWQAPLYGSIEEADRALGFCD